MPVKGSDRGARNKASDLKGVESDKSYRPGYPLDKSIPGKSEDEMLRGFDPKG